MKRERARDSRNRPVRGIYRENGKYVAGFNCPQSGKWRMVVLDADNLTEAKQAREDLLADLRAERVAAPSQETFSSLFMEWLDVRSLSERTRRHEQHLLRRHLADLGNRRVQDVTPRDLGRVLKSMRDSGYSDWTRYAVYRLVKGTFAFAVKRKVLSVSPVEGLIEAEVPEQRSRKREIARLSELELHRLLQAAGSDRWRAAIALGGYAGLRLGEIRGLRWEDIYWQSGEIAVERSLSPQGAVQSTKTLAGRRQVELRPALWRILVALRPQESGYVIATRDGLPVQERNVRRALAKAVEEAELETGERRLSMHSLRHSYASELARVVPATTLARVIGHTDPAFTLRQYAPDSRDGSVIAEEVGSLADAAGFGV